MNLPLLIDADMPRSSAPLARRLGWDALDVRDIGMGSVDDGIIVQYAVLHDRVIVSRDLGFADITRYPPGSYPGMVVLRVPQFFQARQILDVLERFLVAVKPDRFARSLAIVEPGGFRIRH